MIPAAYCLIFPAPVWRSSPAKCLLAGCAIFFFSIIKVLESVCAIGGNKAPLTIPLKWRVKIFQGVSMLVCSLGYIVSTFSWELVKESVDLESWFQRDTSLLGQGHISSKRQTGAATERRVYKLCYVISKFTWYVIFPSRRFHHLNLLKHCHQLRTKCQIPKLHPPYGRK